MDISRISRTNLLGRILRAPLSLIPPATVVPVFQGPLFGKRWIVGSATRNGHRVIVVLLNAPEHQADCRELLDWAFANFVWPEA